MSLLSPILRGQEGNILTFWCPGCGEAHSIRHGGSNTWTWNGDVQRPTFSPSVLVRTGHYAGPGDCWCTYNAAHPSEPAPFQCHQCHSFVRDGQIQFLSDCTHALAGQTVPLPPWPTPETP